ARGYIDEPALTTGVVGFDEYDSGRWTLHVSGSCTRDVAAKRRIEPVIEERKRTCRCEHVGEKFGPIGPVVIHVALRLTFVERHPWIGHQACQPRGHRCK